MSYVGAYIVIFVGWGLLEKFTLFKLMWFVVGLILCDPKFFKMMICTILGQK